MKKKKEKKISKFLIVFIAIVSIFSSVISTKALPWWYDYYVSTLSIGIGRSFVGSTRSYSAGYQVIRFAASQLITDENHKEMRLHVSLEEEQTNSCRFIGSTIFIADSPESFFHNWGYQPSGDYYYGFSTKIGNVSYAGVRSFEVIMASGDMPVTSW